MAIAQAQAPALTCVGGVTGEVGDGEDAIVLVAAIVGGVSKPTKISLNFSVLVLP
jgi:hypothetical protein